MSKNKTIDSFFKRKERTSDGIKPDMQINLNPKPCDENVVPPEVDTLETPPKILRIEENVDISTLIRDSGLEAFISVGFRNWKKVNDGKNCAFLFHMGKLPNSFHNIATKCLKDFKNQSCHIERDESLESENRGNFLEMIKLLASYNDNVNNVILENAPQNARYASPSIQKEILHIFPRKVQLEIPSKIGQGYDGPSNIRESGMGCEDRAFRQASRIFCLIVAQVSETDQFALYLRNRVDMMLELESSWHGRSVNYVLTNFRREIAVGSQKCSRNEKSRSDLRNVHKVRVKSLVAYTRNCGRISETFTKYESKSLVVRVSETDRFALYLQNRVDLTLELVYSSHGRSVNHVLTYSRRETAVGPQKCSRRAGIMSSHIPDEKPQSDLRNIHEVRVKSNVAQVRIVFAKPSGFDARIVVFMAWKELDSCLNIFWTRNRGRISETFTKYDSKNISDKKSQSDLRKVHVVQVKSFVEQMSETDRFALYLRNRVDFTLELEPSWHGRSVNDVSRYFGQDIAIGSQKRSRSTSQKYCCAIVMALKEHEFFLNIFRTKNCSQILEMFMKYESKVFLRN
ncbi:zinc finger MYM-type protein 1-like [Senna tora]|uniref:Zinc finger MYM-type protein 1-like n=1 Tax=Senna tora TaxID=362788 RepID=A0A834WIJ0_9FABA|nr:zinc finger MYM-type protein 1-like [Senna tora]